MEDTLGEKETTHFWRAVLCLNPCFNGRYSRRSIGAALIGNKVGVLILVLMEDTLGGINYKVFISFYRVVLILVLMEDTLGASVNFESVAIALS